MSIISLTRGAVRREFDPPYLLASKLEPPFIRRGVVERTGLLDRLAPETTPTVLSVVAPAGFGKSTLLRQWVDSDPRPGAWLTLDDDDNDPVVLLTYLAAALDRIAPVDPDVLQQLAVSDPSLHTIVATLGTTLASQPEPVALVLDDTQVLENHDCRDIIATLTDHVPYGSQLAVASRNEPPLPIQRLRAQGRLTELGAGDLALDDGEAAALLHGAGVELADADIHDLVAATEGWAVPIYLAARSMKVRGSRSPPDLGHLGEHRHVVAYVQAELLSAQPIEVIEFLTRSAVLDRMSGPLADAVLMTTGSAERLELLTRSNILLAPLDEHRRWYRYHHVFRTLLRAELERREPDLIPTLNLRAAQWCEANGLPDAAVGYAMAAGDADRAAAIIQQRVMPLYRVGRIATALRWFDWFDSRGVMERYPAVATLGAWLAALTGHPVRSERWGAVADRASVAAMLPDARTPAEGLRAVVQSGLCRHGIDQARADVEAAERLVPADSAWRPLTVLMVGLVDLMSGDPEHADAVLSHAVELASDDDAMPTGSFALAVRALIALDRGDHPDAQQLIDRARDMVAQAHLHEHISTALVSTADARIAIASGDVQRATTCMVQAQRLRPKVTYALPFVAVQTRLELIRALLGLADAPGARTVMREVDEVLRLRPDLGVLPVQAERLRAQINLTPVGTIGASSLTAAELRLLPLLQTHLTFRGIGERLYVSPHTVKTQAISIYRKLGVSSRGDAVQTAAELGLLTR